MFFHFFKLWFCGLLGERGLKRQKMAQNDKKLCLASYLRNCTSYDCGFCTHVENGDISNKFFQFFKSLIFLVFQNSLVNAKRKFRGVLHLPHLCVILFVKL